LGVNVYEKWRGGGNIDVLRPAVEKLSNLMHSHFSFEERLHNLKETKEIRGGSLLAPGWSIMQFILGFTVGHVASSDMAYSRALIANRHLISAL
jgi:hemerythrin